MYVRSAEYYDAIYSYKNYKREVAKLHRLIQKYKRSPGNSLLDVGCGTGGHIPYLSRHYEVEGLDMNPRMLKIARQRHPGIPFHKGDMTRFDLKHKFDVVVSLFSAIGSVKTKPKLQSAIRSMVSHLRPGGVLIVEPWFTPEAFKPGTMHSMFVEKPELRIARMNISRARRGLSILDMHYMVATPRGIRYFKEPLELGLFTRTDYEKALEGSRLSVHYDSAGLTGRGLYLGVAPTSLAVHAP